MSKPSLPPPPALKQGDVVILDYLADQKSKRAENITRTKGAWLLFLPPYCPDLNPIEMAFSAVRSSLRKSAPEQLMISGRPLATPAVCSLP